ncbi:MAG: DUF4062 domain-containing protein [Bacillota bacterium]|nr:DUF4062 domain-containing protein [Bacillota bacterium]
MKSKKLVILVSSSVYGIEELLERIYTLLTTFGYEVWMSHKGTLPVFSNNSALENCLQAVDRCDLFLGIITPYYGSSGKDVLSFTHREIRKAIELKKPRWLLAHDHIVFSRQLLRDMGYKNKDERAVIQLAKKAVSISDLRVIDMYEEAILNDVSFNERQGNWVQKYQTGEDAQLFAVAQFSRYTEVEMFLDENLKDMPKISHITSKRGESS